MKPYPKLTITIIFLNEASPHSTPLPFKKKPFWGDGPSPLAAKGGGGCKFLSFREQKKKLGPLPKKSWIRAWLAVSDLCIFCSLLLCKFSSTLRPMYSFQAVHLNTTKHRLLLLSISASTTSIYIHYSVLDINSLARIHKARFELKPPFVSPNLLFFTNQVCKKRVKRVI